MSSAEAVVDAEVVEERAEAPMAVVPLKPPTLAVTPQVEATELKARLDVIQEAQEKAMVENTDYGVIPGTNKPTLLKPGAEKLSVLFQLDVQLSNEKRWGPGDHLTVVSKATVFHAPTGSRLGFGEGICSTREKKYAYRTANLVCPECRQETVLASKKEPGWFCWKKRGGCGANFGPDDQRIKGQKLGQVDNPDLPDTWNTVVKMAEKRARVDAVLAVTGASALFTQDVEDQEAPQEAEPSPSAPQGIGETAALELLALLKAAGIDAELTADFLRDRFGLPSPLAVAVSTLTPEQAQRMRAAAKKYEAEHRQAEPQEAPDGE